MWVEVTEGARHYVHNSNLTIGVREFNEQCFRHSEVQCSLNSAFFVFKKKCWQLLRVMIESAM